MSEIIEIIDSDSDTEASIPASTNLKRSVYSFSVYGKPTPLPRMRYFRNGLWNKAKPQSTLFRSAVTEAIPQIKNGVLFDKTVTIRLTIWFYLKRPSTDFVSSKRLPDNLRHSSMERTYLPLGPDIDNLAKFVLDALNNLVYVDDRQVVKLEIYKRRDNDGYCNGRTSIEVAPFP